MRIRKVSVQTDSALFVDLEPLLFAASVLHFPPPFRPKHAGNNEIGMPARTNQGLSFPGTIHRRIGAQIGGEIQHNDGQPCSPDAKVGKGCWGISPVSGSWLRTLLAIPIDPELPAQPEPVFFLLMEPLPFREFHLDIFGQLLVVYVLFIEGFT
jgi:hypothetical protein